MTKRSLNNLLELGILEKETHEKLIAIQERKVFSVYVELRTLLYLGVLLFSTGVGILIYKNIGQVGHYASLLLLISGIAVCLFYVTKHQVPYNNKRVEEVNPYADYVLLLGCLLLLSVLGYLQFLFGIFNDYLGLISLLAAITFFAMAYRYDHLGVLSMAITAFAGFWGIAVSPMHWYDFDFFNQLGLQWTGVFLGVGLFAAGLVLEKLDIKKHFLKTYLNFAIIIAFVGSNSLLFRGDDNFLIALLQLGAALALGFYSLKVKTMLYMIYAFVFGYIALTYLIFTTLDFEIQLFLVYLFASCVLFIAFVINLRKKFKTDQ